MALLPDITAFYGGGDEAGRLTSGRTIGTIELVRTQELLRAHLPPPPASVLDVGGGPGAHARWLTDSGYQVLVVDPVAQHVQQARNQGLAAFVGDARCLDQADGSFDAVLMLGPLYHLPDGAGRGRAWREAHRVVKPGGLVAAAALNRYAKLLNLGSPGALDIAMTGLRVRRDGPTTYYHDPSGLRAEARQAGFGDLTVYGVHGPAYEALRAEERRTGRKDLGGKVLETALAAARFADSHPELAVSSLHLLAVARRSRTADQRGCSGSAPAGIS
ncbi:class I SAM-dependent methyltransferase [Streptomyces sp. NPDC059989]|uniref:class I SAM-dependent methyltransferase n=1 Tax=Streptomyces sp. NPDC059989 TaxID=3347026 RepID=UPI003696D0DA